MLRRTGGGQDAPGDADGAQTARIEITVRVLGPGKARNLTKALDISGLMCLARSIMEALAAKSGPPVAGTIRPAPGSILRAIETWQADMERRGCKPESVKQFGRHARQLCEYAGWSSVEDISLTGAQEYLGAQRKSGWTGPTHDHAVSALKCWARYLFATKAVPENPLEFLESSGEQGGQGSRALTLDEVRGIIAAGIERTRRTRKGKGNAALFVAFLCHTGLRHEEASRCKWGSLDLDATPPVLITDPAWSKNGRRDTVPLHPELVRLLADHRKCVRSGKADPVFPHVPNRHTFHMDREAAGVPREDSRGRAASYHSCRKYLATQLDRHGATPGVVARIMRHAEGITQARYIDSNLSEEVQAVQRLPNLWPENEKGVLDIGPESRIMSPSRKRAMPTHTHDNQTPGPCGSTSMAFLDSPSREGSGSVCLAEHPVSAEGFESKARLCPFPDSGPDALAAIEALHAANGLLIRMLREGASRG